MKDLIEQIRNSHNFLFKILVTVISIGLIVYIFPREVQFQYEYTKNSPWLHEDLIAPFDYAILKSEEQVKQERTQIESSTLLHFQLDSNRRIQAQKQLRNQFIIHNTANKTEQLDSAVLHTTQSIVESVYKRGIREQGDWSDSLSDDDLIVLIDNKLEAEYTWSQFHTLQGAFDRVRNRLIQSTAQQEFEIIDNWLAGILAPNVVFDPLLTKQIIQDQIASLPKYAGKVAKNEKIIGRGDLVTEATISRLQSLEKELANKMNADEVDYVLSGQIILVTLSVLVLLFFLSIFRQDIITASKKVVFILFLFTANAYLASIPGLIDSIDTYVLPFCLLPIIIRTFFDTRLASFIHVVSIIVIGLMVKNPFEFVFIQTITGLIAVFSLASLRKRSQLLVTVMIVFITYTLSYLGFSVIQEGTYDQIDFANIGYFAISSLLTLLSYPLMYFLERLFGFISDVTLMELADTNSPLLRKLASKAPGTFQHSLQVANLAEEAAIAINGDALLVRTGALYHDIGKSLNPIYFIENQSGNHNPHDDLSYEESAQVIINHVIDGIELGKKQGLPEQLIDFIRSHHGTTVTRYFYAMSKKQNPEIAISGFQYPGPTPFSKETAILMMADSVEAASRSLKEHTVDSISNLVDQIIDGQAREQQFIRADITFKDISELKKLFKKRLMSIYHVRIEYPDE